MEDEDVDRWEEAEHRWHRPHSRTPDWARHEFDRVLHGQHRIERRLDRIEALLKPKVPVSASVLFTDSKGDRVMDISVPDTQGTVNAAVAFKDADGNPDGPTGAVSWSSDNEGVATVDSSGDSSGLTAVVTILGPLGSAGITATDEGSGVASPPSNITVEAGPPATAEVTFSA